MLFASLKERQRYLTCFSLFNFWNFQCTGCKKGYPKYVRDCSKPNPSWRAKYKCKVWLLITFENALWDFYIIEKEVLRFLIYWLKLILQTLNIFLREIVQIWRKIKRLCETDETINVFYHNVDSSFIIEIKW